MVNLSKRIGAHLAKDSERWLSHESDADIRERVLYVRCVRAEDKAVTDYLRLNYTTLESGLQMVKRYDIDGSKKIGPAKK